MIVAFSREQNMATIMALSQYIPLSDGFIVFHMENTYLVSKRSFFCQKASYIALHYDFFSYN